jgi:hypothetical protein
MINMIRRGIADQFLNATFGVQLAHSIGSLSEVNDEVLHVQDKGLTLSFRKRNPEEPFPPYSAGDGVCEVTCERAVPERIVSECRAQGTLSATKRIVGVVHSEMSEFAGRVLRIKRWCQGHLGHHESIRLAQRFEWSLDAEEWKLFGHKSTGYITFGIPSLIWSTELAQLIENLVSAGNSEPLAHELLRDGG